MCFLWHCPAGFPGSALPTTLPCDVRTFLEGGCLRDCSIRPVWFALRRRIDALLSEIRLSDLVGEGEAGVRELIDITWGPVEEAPAGEAPTSART